eukprot:11164134-Lingulodinium_polyedra.AAC.1
MSTKARLNHFDLASAVVKLTNSTSLKEDVVALSEAFREHGMKVKEAVRNDDDIVGVLMATGARADLDKQIKQVAQSANGIYDK